MMTYANPTGAVGGDISVLSVKYGERTVRKSDVFNDFSALGVPDGELAMDYSFWVIRTAGLVVLFDTGYEIAAHDWLGEISVVRPPQGLELIGVDPNNVDVVITSHFHYDHIGFLGLFKNARVVAATAEHDYWFDKKDRGELDGEFATAEDLEVVARAEAEGRLQLVDAATEVAPGVTVYPVGGHCPGQIIVLVAAKQPIILSADAAHFYDQVENGWPFFAFTDLDEMRRALQFVKQLASDTGAVVVPGHDGRVRENFPAAPGQAGRVATVLA